MAVKIRKHDGKQEFQYYESGDKSISEYELSEIIINDIDLDYQLESATSSSSSSYSEASLPSPYPAVIISRDKEGYSLSDKSLKDEDKIASLKEIQRRINVV